MINILLMAYNSSKFIKEVVESWKKIGKIHIYIDRKTFDNTEEIARSLGIIPELFDFIDFATSRNKILDKFPKGYRIFIDDSYLFVGDVSAFKRELYSCKYDVVSIRIKKDREWFEYSKITKGALVFYKGVVHEYINTPSQHLIQNGHICELSCPSHLERTLKRIPNDFELMLVAWYNDPSGYRNIYYMCRSLMLFANNSQFVEQRLIKYFLVQLISINGPYKRWAVENYRRAVLLTET